MSDLITLKSKKISEILAKKDGETLEEHTVKCLLEFKKFRRNNSHTFENISKKCDIPIDLLDDIIFFTIYLHDVGKATKEFYEEHWENKGHSYHPLYSLYLVKGLEERGLGVELKGIKLNIIALAILSHHTLLHLSLIHI